MLPVRVCPFLLKLALSVRPMVCPMSQGYAVPMGRANPFAYRSADLGPDECLPAPGGAAEETAGGS